MDAKEWDVFRAMLAAENGLLAIRLGGRGDMTDTAVKWKYPRPVPQVPSTLLYQGVLYMVNDSGILLSFDPKTGGGLKQGRLKGAIDKYFASPVGADGKVWLASQDGTISVVTAKAEWEMMPSTRWTMRCSRRPCRPTASCSCGRGARCIRSERRPSLVTFRT